jgi:hypothetical protein
MPRLRTHRRMPQINVSKGKNAIEVKGKKCNIRREFKDDWKSVKGESDIRIKKIND